MPLLINLSISLIEIKRTSIKHLLKEHRCNFEIDEVTFSNRNLEERITLPQMNLHCLFKEIGL